MALKQKPRMMFVQKAKSAKVESGKMTKDLAVCIYGNKV